MNDFASEIARELQRYAHVVEENLEMVAIKING